MLVDSVQMAFLPLTTVRSHRCMMMILQDKNTMTNSAVITITKYRHGMVLTSASIKTFEIIIILLGVLLSTSKYSSTPSRPYSIIISGFGVSDA